MQKKKEIYDELSIKILNTGSVLPYFPFAPGCNTAHLGTARTALYLPAQRADWMVLIQSLIGSKGGAWDRGIPTISSSCCGSEGLRSKNLISLTWIQCSFL